jgi:hypothetical protein
MAQEPEKNRIEEAKKKLYRRDFELKQDNTQYNTTQPKDSEVPESWGDYSNNKSTMGKTKNKSKLSIFNKIFIASIIFFIAALSVTAYLFISGGNVVSSKNVDIEVRGPVSVNGGDELSLQLLITNNNNTSLKFTDLIIEYPNGTRSPEDVNKELTRFRESLGELQTGASVNKVVKSILFGEEGQVSDIKISLEYRVEGSSAIFVKKKTYSVNIISSPVGVSMSILKEVNSNQEMSFDVELSSNSDSVIKDVSLIVDYPFGFEPSNSSIESTYGNNVWSVGDMGPNSKKVIKITGTINGQDNTEKIFGVKVGKKNPKNNREISVIYSSTFETVLIKKPFLGVSVDLNGDKSEEYVANSKEKIRGTLLWVNNLPTKISNAVIEVKFDGDVLNKFSVSVDSGFYNSRSNNIIWNKNSSPELGSIEPGGTGRMSFVFSPKSLLDPEISDLENPEIGITVSVRGKRVSEKGKTEEIDEFIKRKILVNSDLKLTSRLIYYGGQFKNNGPLPPKAENTTEYTVVWNVINSSNDVSDVKVKANLPTYVDWANVYFPSQENISYNKTTGEIMWNIGRMNAGEGVSSQGREVSFKVSFTPSITQIGRVPAIVSGVVLTGSDDFTGKIISSNKQPLTTNLTTDPSFKAIDAQVVE